MTGEATSRHCSLCVSSLEPLPICCRAGMSAVQTAKVSHELHTPLNGIIGLSQALLIYPSMRADDAELVRSITAVRDSGTRLNILVNKLLDTVACGEGTLSLECGPVHLKDCLSTVSTALIPLLASDVELKTSLPEDLPPVEGDRDRLVQVFFGLVGNSVKFCRRGTISIKAYTQGKRMVVEVSDTGPGIPVSMLEKVFVPAAPFSTSRASRQRPKKSSGFGLALVKALVEKHGGCISVHSNLGVLTTFTTTLPLWQGSDGTEAADTPSHSLGVGADSGAVPSPLIPAATVPSPASAIGGLQGSKKRETLLASDPHGAASREALPPIPEESQPQEAQSTIGGEPEVEVLSVDDDATTHVVLGHMCKSGGFLYTMVENGAKAIQLLAERQQSGRRLPSVILMDSRMPKMDGPETTRRIRSMFPESVLPVIMISAEGTEESQQAALEAGCSQYLTKPVKRADLLEKIRGEVRAAQPPEMKPRSATVGSGSGTRSRQGLLKAKKGHAQVVNEPQPQAAYEGQREASNLSGGQEPSQTSKHVSFSR